MKEGSKVDCGPAMIAQLCNLPEPQYRLDPLPDTQYRLDPVERQVGKCNGITFIPYEIAKLIIRF